MIRYVLRRFFHMLVTLWSIVTLTFILMHHLPGDPFSTHSDRLTKAQKEVLFRQYGLDKPVWEQYIGYIKNVAKGDLGVSYQYPARKVTEIIAQGFPASLELATWAILLALVCGLSLGITAALCHNKGWDRFSMFVAVLGVSVPSFVLGPFLSYFVGVKLGWLPPGLWSGPEHRILPVIALSFPTLALLARMTRTSMLEVLHQDYIKTAKAKGLSQSEIVVKHALRNAVLPVVTVLGPILANTVVGAIVVEQIFSIPGLGKHFVQAVYANDYTMIMGLTIFYSVILVSLLFLTDILYGLIDPRIRLAKGKG